MIDPGTIQPYDVKKYHYSFVTWLGNLAGQIKSIEQSQERIRKQRAVFAENPPEDKGEQHE